MRYLDIQKNDSLFVITSAGDSKCLHNRNHQESCSYIPTRCTSLRDCRSATADTLR